VSNHFAVSEASDDVEKACNNLKDTVSAAVKKVIGYKRGSKKEQWISASTWKVTDERTNKVLVLVLRPRVLVLILV